MKEGLGRIAVPIAVLMCLWAASAAGQLYRWVDPETGSVKLSSYPPPWFNDAAKQPRAPKVEVIAPARTAPAFERRQELDRESAAPPAGDAAQAPRGDQRAALLKLLAQRVAALAAATPEAAERAFSALSEALQELERLERQSKPSNPKDETTRLEEKSQLAAPLEANRIALAKRIAGLRPPPPGAAPEALANAWRGTQLQLAALEWTNEALRVLDPRRLNARHFEMRALVEQVSTLWEPYSDAASGRRDRGR